MAFDGNSIRDGVPGGGMGGGTTAVWAAHRGGDDGKREGNWVDSPYGTDPGVYAPLYPDDAAAAAGGGEADAPQFGTLLWKAPKSWSEYSGEPRREEDGKIKKAFWTGNGIYRAVRTFGIAVFGGVALAIASLATGGNGDPLKMLRDSHDALLATVIIGSAVATYQMINMVRELRKEESDGKVQKNEENTLLHGTGRYRLLRALGVIAALTLVLLCWNRENFDPFKLMDDNKKAFWTTIVVLSGTVGYHGGCFINEALAVSAKGREMVAKGKKLAKEIAWDGKQVYRLARTVILLGLGALALALTNNALHGNMNPIELLQENSTALLITLVASCAILGYQMGTMAKEMYREKKPGMTRDMRSYSYPTPAGSNPNDYLPYAMAADPVLDGPDENRVRRVLHFAWDVAFSGKGEYFRMGRILLYTILLAGLVMAIGGNWNPLEVLKDSKAFFATLIGGSLVGGYQLGSLFKDSVRAGVAAYRKKRYESLVATYPPFVGSYDPSQGTPPTSGSGDYPERPRNVAAERAAAAAAAGQSYDGVSNSLDGGYGTEVRI